MSLLSCNKFEISPAFLASWVFVMNEILKYWLNFCNSGTITKLIHLERFSQIYLHSINYFGEGQNDFILN